MLFNSLSEGFVKLLNAEFRGANTVKSVSKSDNNVVNVVLLLAVRAPTKDVKLGFATA